MSDPKCHVNFFLLVIIWRVLQVEQVKHICHIKHQEEAAMPKPSKKVVSVRDFPDSLWSLVRIQVIREKITMTAFLVRAITNELKRCGALDDAEAERLAS